MLSLYYIIVDIARVKMLKFTKKLKITYKFMQIVNKITKMAKKTPPSGCNIG